MRLQRCVPLVVLSAFLAAPSYGQFREHVDVTVMNLDVEVRDSAGNPVRGLTAEDFEIREGRSPREITNFTEYASGRGTQSSSDSARSSGSPVTRRPPLHLVIFVDQRDWSVMDHERVGTSLMNMVEEHLQPGDRVRIVGWRNRLRDIVGWTDDSERVRLGLDAAFGMSDHSGLTHIAEVDSRAVDFEKADPAETGAENFAIGSAGPSTVTEAVADAQRWAATKMRWSQLTTVANEMAALDGRRMMILVTTRVGRAMGTRATRGDDPSVHLRDRFVGAATASGVAVSFLYPEPRTSGMSAEVAQPGLPDYEISFRDFGPLGEVAERTGGTLAWGAGMIERQVPRIAEGLSNFYSIGYRSDLEEGERRDISVRVNGRDDLHVLARRSVARLSDQERLEAMVIAHAIKPETSQLPLNVEVAPAPARLGRRAVKVAVRFMMDDITFDVTEREAIGGFLVAAVAVDSRTGESGQVVVDRHELRLPIAEYDALQPGQHLTWDAEVRYSPQSDTVAIGVMDTISELTGLIRAELPSQ